MGVWWVGGASRARWTHFLNFFRATLTHPPQPTKKGTCLAPFPASTTSTRTRSSARSSWLQCGLRSSLHLAWLSVRFTKWEEGKEEFLLHTYSRTTHHSNTHRRSGHVRLQHHARHGHSNGLPDAVAGVCRGAVHRPRHPRLFPVGPAQLLLPMHCGRHCGRRVLGGPERRQLEVFCTYGMRALCEWGGWWGGKVPTFGHLPLHYAWHTPLPLLLTPPPAPPHPRA